MKRRCTSVLSVALLLVTIGSGPASGAWFELKSPPGFSKHGGWLSYDSTSNRVYYARGGKTLDFLAYDVALDSWFPCAHMPAGSKPPGKGGNTCSDWLGHVYCAKGNNTSEFYRYHAELDTWQRLREVPLGLTGKRVKVGTDLTYVARDAGYAYLLKGYKNEFYRYAVGPDTWESRRPVPGDKWGAGSWAVHDRSDRIFAHQARFHGFFAHSVTHDTWATLPQGMPFISSQGTSKRSKDGGCAVWFQGAVYALKGGNTLEFWKYVPTPDTWGGWREQVELPLIGSRGMKKKVKAGSDITASSSAIYVMTGSGFWMYVPDTFPRSGVQAAGTARARKPELRLYPNPALGGMVRAVLSLSLCTGAVLHVRDVLGREVARQDVSPGSAAMLDLSGVRPGIYVVELECPGVTAVQKLLVAR